MTNIGKSTLIGDNFPFNVFFQMGMFDNGSPVGKEKPLMSI